MTTKINLTVKRGDTKAIVFTISDPNGNLTSLDGWTGFVLTVDPEKEPTDATNNIEVITGVVVDSANKIIGFSPDGNSAIGRYYYDVQGVDTNAEKITLVEGSFKIKQDISKA